VERERTSVGLDVHARSVVACGIDDDTGEMFRARLVPQPEAIFGWLRELPGPLAVVYEAGPTGFGLARFLTGQGVRCAVAAPSKLQRPSGDRVKTDAKDALHLARLLRLGEVTPVAVPTVTQEAARDLVRVREDVRGDLMRARHRTSKLLLCQGIVYSGGTAWTAAHHHWLGRHSFDQPTLAAAYDSALETVLLTADRRDRLDKAIVELATDPAWSPADGQPAVLPAGGVDADRVRPDGRGRRLVAVHRLEHRRILGTGPDRAFQRSQPQPGLDHQDWQHPRPPAAGRGGLAPQAVLPPVEGAADPLGRRPGGGPGPRTCRQPAAAPTLADLRRAQETAGGRDRRRRPRARRLVLVAGHPGHHGGLTAP